MMKKTLLLLALTVNVLGVAEGSFAGETNFSSSSHGPKVTEAQAVVGTGETEDWNGSIPGQFLDGRITDFVKGVGSSDSQVSGVVWDGFIAGQLGSPRSRDRAVLPIRKSGGKEAWDGYVAGSLGYWQRKI